MSKHIHIHLHDTLTPTQSSRLDALQAEADKLAEQIDKKHDQGVTVLSAENQRLAKLQDEIKALERERDKGKRY